MFDAFLEISRSIIPKSYSLLVKYVDMDKKMRTIEQKLTDGEFTLPESELKELTAEKNRLKEPYERSQQSLETFFVSFQTMMSYFLEQDRDSNQNTVMTKVIAKNHEQV